MINWQVSTCLVSEHNVNKLFQINLCVRLRFKMENEKLHFLVTLCEFKKGVGVRSTLEAQLIRIRWNHKKCSNYPEFEFWKV